MRQPRHRLALLVLAVVCLGFASGQIKINCFPELPQTQDPGKQRCEERKCDYVTNRGPNEPFCLWTRSGYRITRFNITRDKSTELLSASIDRLPDYNGPFPTSGDLDELKLTVKAISDKGLRITISDPDLKRYQVPKAALDIPEPGLTSQDSAVYSWVANDTAAGSFLTVRRKSAAEGQPAVLRLLTTGFVFSEQFIQLAVGLGCSHVIGLGEHNHERLVHDRQYKRWSIFTRDASPTGPGNIYGAHPYFVCSDGGKSTGVLLKNSNAMEIELTPDGAIYRVLGGILDFYVFMAETPEELARTYSAAIGHPLMPPYWSLGFQLCRWGYQNISEVRDVIARNRAIGLPYDVQYGDIDYMQNTMDFTIDRTNYPGLSDMVDDLHRHGQKYFVILDPAISSDTELHKRVLPGGKYGPYEDGLLREIFVKNPNGSVHQGEVWPGRTVFPDFTLPATLDWWQRWVSDFYYNQSIRVDGLWIDMNEPASFTYEDWKPQPVCPNNTLNYPPYIPTSFIGKRFYEKTLCMEAKHNWGDHYDSHSLYGHAMGIQSYQTLRNLFPEKRPIVFSRSTFVGSGRYAQHWLGDNHSRWPNLHWSIVTMLEFGLFGFPYTGADICGFVFDAEREMCIRWTQLGAFYPFSRNHNIKETDGKRTRDQDPATWDVAAQKIMKDALFFRYKHLPYLYTLFHFAHTEGATVIRSLSHEFPADPNAVGIDRQFLWGGAMLISPVLEAGATNVTAYLPAEGWYDAFTGKEVAQTGNVTLQAPLEHINVHIRKGHILPWQDANVTTASSRKLGMGLLVAGRRSDQTGGMGATGSLFWDDGESFETFKTEKYILHKFDFAYDKDKRHHKLDITATVSKYTDPNSVQFKNVTILGFEAESPAAQLSVTVNSLAHTKVRRDAANRILYIEDLSLALGSSHQLIIAAKAGVTTAVASWLGLLSCILLVAASWLA